MIRAIQPVIAIPLYQTVAYAIGSAEHGTDLFKLELGRRPVSRQRAARNHPHQCWH